jgi:hypothetical protein
VTVWYDMNRQIQSRKHSENVSVETLENNVGGMEAMDQLIKTCDFHANIIQTLHCYHASSSYNVN